MKGKLKKPVVITIACVMALSFIYGAFCCAALSAEYDGEGGFTGRAAYALSHVFSDPAPEVFKKTVYRFFGAVTEPGVASGGDGYLFPTKTDKFDYEADIAGKAHYNADVSDAFYNSITERKEALALDGCELFVFVIPNSQTVLRDKLKTGDKNGVTAAQELEKYLRNRGLDCFYMLDTALAGSDIAVYHNTANKINGYGAYKIYRRISSLLPETVTRRFREAVVTPDDISVVMTDGMELAKLAGLEKSIKNKTVLYPTAPFASAFTATAENGATVCRLRDEYNDFIGFSDVLFQIPDKDERELFIPLFSSSYTDTVYKNSLSYPGDVMKSLKPSVCVCIVREDSLSSLLDKSDLSSYEARAAGEKGGVTPAPVVITASCKRSGTAFIAGECSADADVTVSSDDGSVTVKCREGRFIAELPAKPGAELTVFTSIEGKAPSEPVRYLLPKAALADENVFSGASSTLYYGATVSDYTGANMIRPALLSRMQKHARELVGKIRDASGKETQIIFLAAPNPLSVYPDSASAELIKKRADQTRLDQLCEALSGVEGFTLLDIRKTMKENTDVDKLYYQTDTHWTETGAYFGYRAIVEAVGGTPYSLNSFKQKTAVASAGDLASFAGLDSLTENVRFLSPLYKPRAVGIPPKPDTIDRTLYSGELTSAVDDDSLPKAVMIRDSYSANLFPFISEHFSFLYCQSMWQYEPDYEMIERYAPDYVIYVICERNLNMLS